MTDTPLLVPMHLDALALGEEAADATPFRRFQMEYGNLQYFNSPEPPPFATADAPAPGVYLHWTLPQALRQGVQNDDGSTDYPLVPNRWLVVRVEHGAAADAAVKAWVIVGDFADPQAGTSPYVEPFPAGDSAPAPTAIGQALRLTADLTSIPSQSQPFLRAVGPGSIWFASFAPGVMNVLSFYDDLTAADDQTQIDQGTFTYHVAGWYDGGAGDPLTGTTWSASTDPSQSGALVNDTLDWVVYPDGDAAPPDWSLVHALVAGVPWDRTSDTPPPQDYPQDVPSTVKVAFGNTAADALAAIVRLQGTQDAATEADLLMAFQYGELEQFDQPGSAEALNNAIKRHWFQASPGGTAWTVVAPQRSGSTALPAPAPVPLTADQAAALAKLNAAQDEADRQSRILSAMQWNLFSLWWKYQYQDNNAIPIDDPQGLFASQLAAQVGITPEGGTAPSCDDRGANGEKWYYCLVQAQQEQVTTLGTAATDAAAALDALLDPATQVRRQIPRPQFFSPNDPVMLATGLGRATEMDPGDAPVCRLVSQTVTSLTVSGTEYCAGGGCAHDVTADVPVLADPGSLLPAGVQELNTEAFFLSASLFATDALGDPSQTQAVSDAIAALPAAGSGSTFPPDAGAYPVWAQPWVPLLLEWQVTILQGPAYGGNTGDYLSTFAQSNWGFDGTDFFWVGPTTAGDGNFDESNLQMQLQGRTFITPQLSLTLAGQLEQYVGTHQQRDPNLQALLGELEQYLETIQAQDLLSQRLGGLRSLMVQRDLTSTSAPFGDVADALGDPQHGYPSPDPDQFFSTAPALWDFAPMAGTFWVVNRLSVLDTQGRTVELTLANYSTDPMTPESVAEYYFYPIAGRGLQASTAKSPAQGQGQSTDPTQRMMMLPPRIQQDSRLSFELTASDGSDSPVWIDPSLNPVCGWVVPNHLDRSLALYAPDGTAWGELYLSLQAGGSYVPAWQPDPTNPDAPQAVADIPNAYVRGIVQALWDRTDNGAGFYDFLQVIDETLWSIDPGSSHQDEDLAVLVGRPLAVVRAEMALRLGGLPRYSQDWWNTFATSVDQLPDPPVPVAIGTLDGGVCDLDWQVRLGSQSLRTDGLIGYWVDDAADPSSTYDVFNTVTLPPETVTEDYLAQIGAGNYLPLRFTDDTVDAPDPASHQLARLTLLLDPRGVVHAYSGLLPVVELKVPSSYTSSALKTISYCFRAGPFLTSPDQVRIPPPAEQKGTWGWFDYVQNAVTPPGNADGKVRFGDTPPLVKEGWLKFTPAPPIGGGG